MLSIEECKKILHSKGKKYTDAEIEKIREYLYKMSKVVDDENSKLKKNEKV